MMFQVPGNIVAGAKNQYICTLLNVELFCFFYTICTYIGHTTSAHLKYILLGLGIYFFPMNLLSKQKHEMQQIMRELKLMCYAAHMIGA